MNSSSFRSLSPAVWHPERWRLSPVAHGPATETFDVERSPDQAFAGHGRPGPRGGQAQTPVKGDKANAMRDAREVLFLQKGLLSSCLPDYCCSVRSGATGRTPMWSYGLPVSAWAYRRCSSSSEGRTRSWPSSSWKYSLSTAASRGDRGACALRVSSRYLRSWRRCDRVPDEAEEALVPCEEMDCFER